MNLYRALKKLQGELNFELELLEKPIDKTYRIIFLPGVGHFEQAMKNLVESKMDRFIFKNYHLGATIVGVCLGMQLFFEESEESPTRMKGLGLLKGRVEKLNSTLLPHMGWNTVRFKLERFKDMDGKYFYFVHSYRAVCEERLIVGTCEYDGEVFPAVVMDERLIGVQFHPEKSHTVGRTFLRRLIECALCQP